MKGNRALTKEEIEIITEYFEKRMNDNYNAEGKEIDKKLIRNYTIFFFSLYSGFRVSENLSLQVKDVFDFSKYNNDKPNKINDLLNYINDDVYLKRENTKGKLEGRMVNIPVECRQLLAKYIQHYDLHNLEPTNSLFARLTKKYYGKSISARQVEYILKKIFNDCDFKGKLACHSTRKTFAKNMYELLNENIVDLQQAMGHKSLNSTVSYINSDRTKIRKALLNLNFLKNKD